VSLDPTRGGRDAGRIADEVIAHFEGVAWINRDGNPRNRGRNPSWCPRSGSTGRYDSSMIIDAMAPAPRRFCLVSSDSDFTRPPSEKRRRSLRAWHLRGRHPNQPRRYSCRLLSMRGLAQTKRRPRARRNRSSPQSASFRRRSSKVLVAHLGLGAISPKSGAER